MRDMRHQRTEIRGQRSEDRGQISSQVPCPLSPVPSLRFRPGFTLIELLLAVVIFGVVLGVVLVSFLVSRSSFLSSDAYIQVQEQARRALDNVRKELRQAGNADSPSTNPNVTFTNANRLNFQLARGYNVTGCGAAPNPCACNAICWGNDTTNGGWVHYLLNPPVPPADGAQLLRCQSNGSDTAFASFAGCQVLANNVQTFQMDYANTNRELTIRLQVTQASTQLPGGSMSTGPPNTPLITRLRLRNPG